ncbi:hypothetical protein PoB_002214500 [Plakobranchus ocellatus]|uniref:Uncharacterized protein n=1 Tax=Plakobranchus ocellatus TaxID=259542 RepID=A0AAV3ZKG2_9GAST|nr:hypothetical protein PoB_002214500 [Plakobranchus ocellatus]
MAPLKISFLIRTVYDPLPSSANLVRQGMKDDSTFPSMPRQADYTTCSQFLKSSSKPEKIHVAAQQIATRACNSNMGHKRPTYLTQDKGTSIHIRR